MKASYVLSLAAALFACSLVARAECVYPKPPSSVPDGKSASEAEMMEAMKVFKAYNESVTAFIACLEEETKSKAAGSAQLMQLKTLQTKKHNAAVDELQAVAKVFNEQVRLFKTRS